MRHGLLPPVSALWKTHSSINKFDFIRFKITESNFSINPFWVPLRLGPKEERLRYKKQFFFEKYIKLIQPTTALQVKLTLLRHQAQHVGTVRPTPVIQNRTIGF